MAEYIRREAVLKRLRTLDSLVASYIEKMPYADAEPVKHGRWEKHYHSYFGLHQCVCSECKGSEYWKKYYCYGVESYCPNCGARMDGESDG